MTMRLGPPWVATSELLSHEFCYVACCGTCFAVQPFIVASARDVFVPAPLDAVVFFSLTFHVLRVAKVLRAAP